MNRIYLSCLVLGCLFGTTLCLKAQISLPSIFTDHMVLQQNSKVAIWGWGAAHNTISVVGSWAPGDTAKAVAASDGSWKTTLTTIKAGGPYAISITGSGEKILQDVMLGEVWLCSGQSNMDFNADWKLMNKEAEIAAANHPNIRIFNVLKRGAAFPQNNCEGAWAICTPNVMRNTSSVAYFFSRNLQDSLKVPVGLIVTAWGGTPAEVWTPKEKVMSNESIVKAIPAKTYPWWPVEPGVLYNQMIHPFVPYGIAGAIWYQGEANVDHSSSYATLLKTMIESWRKNFEKEFPFYIVQIAPYTYKSSDNGPAKVREAEEWVSKNIHQSGLVVTSDLVNDINDIHPVNKQDVGLRLAKLALVQTYGRVASGYASPLLENIRIEKNKAILSFSHAENGLICKGKQVTGLTVAGEDGSFVNAKAKIKGNELIVSAPKIKHPVKVEYCFDDATVGNLFNTEGLPVAPFRTNAE
ncbi:MAG: sialate O-acetylesterase [Parabacteroides sp.]|nr:sialate O-acetylesterase [Parabacteroides sp.]